MANVDEIKRKALEDISNIGGHVRMTRFSAPASEANARMPDELLRKGQLGKTYKDAVRQLQAIGGEEATAAIDEIAAAARDLKQLMPSRKSPPIPPPSAADSE